MLTLTSAKGARQTRKLKKQASCILTSILAHARASGRPQRMQLSRDAQCLKAQTYWTLAFALWTQTVKVLHGGGCLGTVLRLAKTTEVAAAAAAVATMAMTKPQDAADFGGWSATTIASLVATVQITQRTLLSSRSVLGHTFVAGA